MIVKSSVIISRFLRKYTLVILAVGDFSGIVLSYGKVLSFLAGYAGLDLIEGYYKVFKKKKIQIK